MKSAHVQPGGPTPALDRLVAALSGAREKVVCLAPGGPEVVARWRIARALKRFAPDVVVAWSPQAVRLAPSGPWVMLGRPEAGGDPAPYATCDHLLATTPAEARRMVNLGWPAAHVHVLPAVVPDLAGARPSAHAAPADARIVLAIAPLVKSSGLDILLAAMTRLPEAHALIAGEGPERGALKALARQAAVSGRVHFLGARADTAGLLAASDVVVCPARQDLLAEGVLQAFSAGKPVVATMAEAPLDLLRAGAAGILVPADSGIALAAGIEGMLANSPMARAMAAEGRRLFEAGYAAPAVAVEWRAVLGRLGLARDSAAS